jgi:hypothetical protein
MIPLKAPPRRPFPPTSITSLFQLQTSGDTVDGLLRKLGGLSYLILALCLCCLGVADHRPPTTDHRPPTSDQPLSTAAGLRIRPLRSLRSCTKYLPKRGQCPWEVGNLKAEASQPEVVSQSQSRQCLDFSAAAIPRGTMLDLSAVGSRENSQVSQPPTRGSDIWDSGWGAASTAINNPALQRQDRITVITAT